MRGWFRSLRRPAPVQPPKPDGWDDRGYAQAHRIPLNKWMTLPPEQQRALRLNVAHAPQFQEVTR